MKALVFNLVIVIVAGCFAPWPAVVVAQAGPVISPSAPPMLADAQPKQDLSGLTEVQRLKVELLQARITIAQLRATVADREARLASIELTQEQEKLVQEFRQTLKADPRAEFDWTTLKFKTPGQQPTPKQQ